MTSWDLARERRVWWAAIAVLTIVIGWLQVVNLVLLWNVFDERFPQAVTLVRAVARAVVAVVWNAMPALMVGFAVVVTMTLALAGSLAPRKEVQNG